MTSSSWALPFWSVSKRSLRAEAGNSDLKLIGVLSVDVLLVLHFLMYIFASCLAIDEPSMHLGSDLRASRFYGFHIASRDVTRHHVMSRTLSHAYMR